MSKTLEDLGYEKEESEYNIVFRKDNTTICFVKKLKALSKDLLTNNGKFVACNITMEELKAIYQYCIDNKWI
jgi:tRNA U34 2-thiouridine synthase MnmA/TrmU